MDEDLTNYFLVDSNNKIEKCPEDSNNSTITIYVTRYSSDNNKLINDKYPLNVVKDGYHLIKLEYENEKKEKKAIGILIKKENSFVDPYKIDPNLIIGKIMNSKLCKQILRELDFKSSPGDMILTSMLKCKDFCDRKFNVDSSKNSVNNNNFFIQNNHNIMQNCSYSGENKLNQNLLNSNSIQNINNNNQSNNFNNFNNNINYNCFGIINNNNTNNINTPNNNTNYDNNQNQNNQIQSGNGIVNKISDNNQNINSNNNQQNNSNNIQIMNQNNFLFYQNYFQYMNNYNIQNNFMNNISLQLPVLANKNRTEFQIKLEKNLNELVMKKNEKLKFPTIGLNNIGSTCYMNATLQCLLHINELVNYLTSISSTDLSELIKKNSHVSSNGQISQSFIKLCKEIYDESKAKISNNCHSRHRKYYSYNLPDSIYPTDFKNIIGTYNPQFRRFEANDSKDLILYILQSMHEELNIYNNNIKITSINYDQSNVELSYNVFDNIYNKNNFSIISKLFYGTYIFRVRCKGCTKEIYNFQKFEMISFDMSKYKGRYFNVIEGFKDNNKSEELNGDNKIYCRKCHKAENAEILTTIFEPPHYLIINIDYGNNKKYQPSKINFDEKIDISQYINNYNGNNKNKFEYRIVAVCTHLGYSGSSGHYIAFCKDTNNDKWHEFNDSYCSQTYFSSINKGSPYLLIYEMIK